MNKAFCLYILTKIIFSSAQFSNCVMEIVNNKSKYYAKTFLSKQKLVDEKINLKRSFSKYIGTYVQL